jgi:ATP-binding cassette subfamily G (WHITE) protein 2 (PDR)
MSSRYEPAAIEQSLKPPFSDNLDSQLHLLQPYDILHDQSSKGARSILFLLLDFVRVQFLAAHKADANRLSAILCSFTLTLTMSMFFRSIASLSRTLSQALAPAAILILALIIYTGFALPVK